jgi:hypothetical protein
MVNEWTYIQYNDTTEMYDVLKQVRYVKNDVVLRSFKRERNAENHQLHYELNINNN